MRPELVLSYEERRRRFVRERINEELDNLKNDKAENSSVAEESKGDDADIHRNIDIIEISQEEKCPVVYNYNPKGYIHKKFRIRSHEFNFSSVNS